MYQYEEQQPPRKSLRWFLAVSAAFLTFVASTHLASAGESAEYSHADEGQTSQSGNEHNKNAKVGEERESSGNEHNKNAKVGEERESSGNEHNKNAKVGEEHKSTSSHGSNSESSSSSSHRSSSAESGNEHAKNATVGGSTASRGSSTCPDDVAKRVSDYSVTADGKSLRDLGGQNAKVDSGQRVTIEFTVEEGCEGRYTFASYEADSTSVSEEAVSRQKLFDYESKQLDAGSHRMTVDLPECIFQVDFVEGKVIKDFGEEGNFYRDRLIDSAIGGEECSEVQEKVVERKSTTTTTEAPEVKEETVTRPQVEEVEEGEEEVGSEELAVTGINPFPLTAAGSLLLGLGMVMVRRSRTMSDWID